MNGSMLVFDNVMLPGGRSLFNHAGFEKEEERLMFVRGDTPQGATRMAILHPNLEGLRPGHYFGIGHRLYIVARAWQISLEDVTGGAGENQVYDDFDPVLDDAEFVYDGPVTGGGGIAGTNVQVIDFWPRLRDAAPDGTPLILGRPVCRMRLASDDGIDFEQTRDAMNFASLSFEEAV